MFVFSVSKCRLSSRLRILVSKLVIFKISFIVTKLSICYLRSSTIDPWLELKFWKLPEIRIWTFLCIFILSKCCLSPRVGIVISKLVLFEISLIKPKLSIFCLKCSSMDPWLELKFWKYPEIRIWTFLCEFIFSKCCLSVRVGIVMRKFVFLDISLIVKKDSLSWMKCSTMDPRLQLKFWKHLEIRIFTFFYVFSVSRSHL